MRRLRAKLGATLVGLWLGATLAPAAHADQQRDPQLKELLERIIGSRDCFLDKYDSEVWYKAMEPRLLRFVPSHEDRISILDHVYCESKRDPTLTIPPDLVLAMIDVESRFDAWAVSPVGAVGLMQVMPFWPEKLGIKRYELIHTGANIHMGCAILRYYLRYERNDVRKALARYNGSVGQRNYPAMVISRWTRWNGADDLGFPSATPLHKKQ